MNILIVDDEILVVSLIKKCIAWKEIGIDEAFYCYNAFEARRIVTEQKIDIIICDIEMPQEDGLHFLSWIKLAYPGIIKIILTGFPDFQYAQTAIEIGVFKYLLKPVSFDKLKKAVSEAIKEVNVKAAEMGTAALNGHSADGDHSRNDMPVNVKSSNQKVAAAIKEYIEAHYREEITRQDIEDLVHMNEDYVNRIFKQQTGYSFVQYIQYYRILTAKRLMKEEHLSVTEISERVGFDSPAYFSRVFKKWTSMSPNEYYASLKE